MLPRSPPGPHSRSSLFSVYVDNNAPTPTPYPHHLAFDPPPAYQQNSGLPMDPSSVDFRAFYPYTPNEVKHRKRTTTAQLKTLESVFKRDTKPNGPLRIELAAQLGMTARGVQVWFQNRRAKEKTKAGKIVRVAPTAGKTDTPYQDELSSHSNESAKPTADEPGEAQRSSALTDRPELGESSSPSLSPTGASPPQLHLITDHSLNSWQDLSTELSDDADRACRSTPADSSLHAYRRGSLPANMFPHAEYSSNSPPLVDSFDPLARRLSVDASLQRLANNPYAHLARAKNGAVHGTRIFSHPFGRHRPYGPHTQRPCLSHNVSAPYGVDMHRASMDSRAFRLSPRGTASPSPSPLTPYHAVRASLPDHHLYTVTSRNVASPIPGPLPSPNFSFGAASTPAMTSPSSGDSERNSPDSLQSFTFRGDDLEEDDSTSASYGSYSRFGSITSIATSESSINSAHYSDVGGCVADHELGIDFDSNSRCDSCASGHFLTLMSGLDVNGMPEAIAGSLDCDSYLPHEDLNRPSHAIVDSNGSSNDSSTYPSPTSTISPGPNGSPHAQDAPRSSVPISRSSELAFALQSQSDQMQEMDRQNAFANHSGPPPTEPDIDRSHSQYFYLQNSNNSQSTSTPSDLPLEFADKYHYDADCNTTVPTEQRYDSSPSYVTDRYTIEDHNDLSCHHQHLDFSPVSNVYTAYGEAIDPSVVLPLENATPNAGTFVTYA